MKAKITLPSGTFVEVEASPEEIRRLAGEPGYRLELLPMVPPAICICGRGYVTFPIPMCPVHGGPFRVSWRPLALSAWSSGAVAMPHVPAGWVGTSVAQG